MTPGRSSWAAPPFAGPYVLVPISVRALPVDSYGNSQPWADLTPNFDEIGLNQMVLGEQITHQQIETDPNFLPAGIHLHWALPDGLTHGQVQQVPASETASGVPDSVTTFPFVPNRWLVVRLVTDPSWTPPIFINAWVVTSDRITENPDLPPPLPSWPAGKDRWLTTTKYLGGATPYAMSQADDPTAEPVLTALGPGDPAFAAYYPNCKQVFGYHDNLQDLRSQFPGGEITGTITYLVLGWYSNPQADPLWKSTAPADWVRRLAHLRWAVNPPYPVRDVTPDRTTIILSGFGDLSNAFPVGSEFRIAGSTYNDGTYRVASIHYAAETSEEPSRFSIIVASLPAAVADGSVLPAGTVCPTQTLCHGAVYQVQAPPKTGTLTAGIPTGPLNVAIGNTSVEALAALLATKLSSSDPGPVQDVARVLEAFQYHLLHDLDQPSGAVEVEEAIHSRSFDRVDGGIWWEVCPTSPRGPDPLPDLSTHVGQMLSDLNNKQQQVDGLVRNLRSLQRETYYAWYKRTKVEVTGPSGPQGDLCRQLTDLTNGLIAAITHLQQKQLLPARQELRALITKLTTSPELKGYRLRANAMPRFWRPTDPAVLLAGDGVGRSFAHGEDGRFTTDDTLVCRVSGQTVTGLTVTPPGAAPVTIAARNLQEKEQGGSLPSNIHDSPLPPDATPLLIETLLLDPTPNHDLLLARIAFGPAGVTSPTAVVDLASTIQKIQTAAFNAALHPELRARVERAGHRLAAAAGLCGLVPSAVGFALWKWPWTPLFFYWKAQWYPSYSTEQMNNTRDWGLWSNWPFTPGPDAHSEIDFRWTGVNPKATPLSGIPLSGVVTITPQVTDNFVDRLRQYVTNLPKADLNDRIRQILTESADKLQNLNLLSQSLSGLGSRLMMQWQTLQLPVISLGKTEFGNDDTLAAAVAAAIDDQTATAPIQADEEYFPVRAGHLWISQLWLVDGYGQVRIIAGPGIPVVPVLAESVQTPGDTTGLIQLAPRISQPARLWFRLMDADDDQVQSNSARSTSPVCGWLLPNHLDRSLMVYNAAGQALGELQLLDVSLGNLRWTGVPGQPPALGAPLPKIWNQRLRGFLQGLIDRGFTAGDTSLDDLLRVIDSTLLTVEPLGSRKDQSLSVLIGRPLALVRATLRLELEGLPVADEGTEATQRLADGWITSQTLHFEDRKFTQIRFLVRLGDLRNIRDGLIGFFVNDDYSTFFAVLESVPSANGSGASPYVRSDNRLWLTADPSAPPVTLTLVIDPRAAVHATSGILPVATVEVNPDLIADALAAIDVTFLTGPVLSDSEQVAIPLPAFQSGTWSWIDRPGVTVWQEDGRIDKVSAQATLADKPQRLYEGWLKLRGAIGPNSGGS